MNKLLAIIKREYLAKVRTKFFVIMTILGPLMLFVFTLVPGLLMAMKTGDDTRIAVLDQTEGAQLYEPIRRSLLKLNRDQLSNKQPGIAESVNSNTRERVEKAGKSFTGSFHIEQVDLNGRSVDQIKPELNSRIGRNQLDGYL